MAEARERAWTLDEFFAWQEHQPDRYELVNGRPLRVARAQNAHDDLVVNVLAALGPQLRNSGCRRFTGDGAVETYPGQIRRPDIGVDCGRRDPNGYKAGAPRLEAEVLSPSTRDFDSIGKLAEYKSIDGLAYILFIEPNEASLAVWSRTDDSPWREARVEGLDATVDLSALGASLALSAVYDGVEFPARPAFAAPG